MTDAQVFKLTAVKFTQDGARLFRNFVGGVWAGKKLKSRPGTVTLGAPRFIEAGLGDGTSDGVGWTVVTVTPDMVGKPVAVFTAVECKTDAYPTLTPEQKNFLSQVVAVGGLGYVSREDGEGVKVEPWTDAH